MRFLNKLVPALLMAALHIGSVPGFAANADTPAGAALPAKAQFASSWGDRLRHGGVAAVVQIGLSIFGAGFVFERFARLRRRHLIPDGLADKARDLETVLIQQSRINSQLQEGLMRSGAGFVGVLEHAERAAARGLGGGFAGAAAIGFRRCGCRGGRGYFRRDGGTAESAEDVGNDVADQSFVHGSHSRKNFG